MGVAVARITQRDPRGEQSVNNAVTMETWGFKGPIHPKPYRSNELTGLYTFQETLAVPFTFLLGPLNKSRRLGFQYTDLRVPAYIKQNSSQNLILLMEGSIWKRSVLPKQADGNQTENYTNVRMWCNKIPDGCLYLILCPQWVNTPLLHVSATMKQNLPKRGSH